ncbi:MAG: hypothetical protein GW802_17680 [Armatimonadetes bacterium]|nr:hypothetical protein [Armatimonadota bacterium]
MSASLPLSRRSRGQAAAELAILLPLLALMMAGVVDIARGFHARINLTNAVREGARYGAGAPTDATGIRQAVISELAGTSLKDLSSDAISISTPNGTDARNPLTVSATASFGTFLGSFLGIQSMPLRAQATMMIVPGT